MAYKIDLRDSAFRHFRDGETLLKAKSAQHAGYHFGFAAECAFKSAMPFHIFPKKEDRRGDPLTCRLSADHFSLREWPFRDWLLTVVA